MCKFSFLISCFNRFGFIVVHFKSDLVFNMPRGSITAVQIHIKDLNSMSFATTTKTPHNATKQTNRPSEKNKIHRYSNRILSKPLANCVHHLLQLKFCLLAKVLSVAFSLQMVGWRCVLSKERISSTLTGNLKKKGGKLKIGISFSCHDVKNLQNLLPNNRQSTKGRV